MRFILLLLLLIPTIIGVIYFIYEFSNTPQDFISYDDFWYICKKIINKESVLRGHFLYFKSLYKYNKF